MLIPGNIKYYICRDIKLRYVVSLFIKERLLKRNRVSLYYLNPNANSILLEKCSNFLRKKKDRNFSLQHYDCDMSIMKNEKGIPIIKASGCDDLNKIIGRLSKTELNEGRSVFDYLDEKLSSLTRDLKLYVKQQIALDIFHDLLMANAAHWLNKNRESELYGKNPVYLMEKRSYWSYLVMDHLKDRNVPFNAYRYLSLKKNKGVLFVYHFIRLLTELLMSLIVDHKAIKTPGKAKIGIPFYVFQNFTNFFDIKNYYLYWFNESGIDPDNILIYVPEAEFKISAEEVSNVCKAGFNILYCPTRITSNRNVGVPVYKCSKNAASLLVQYLKQIIKMYVYAKNRSMKEHWKILSLMLIQLPYWEDFFQRNNIRIKFRFHDIFGVRDIAAKLSGAIVLSYHYSNHSDARITREEISDVFFIWGKKYKEILSPEYSTTDTFVQTGYIFDYTFEALRKRASSLRERLRLAGVSYTIGVLDENIARHLKYFTNSILECYKIVLRYAESHPDVGVIIKPKREITFEYLKSSTMTASLFFTLEEQGRIIILDSGKYPVEAGYASDMVIGVIPDSTAGLECVLAGIPMVVYDCTQRKESHPFYKTGLNRIIFDDIQYLIYMIDLNRKRPGAIAGFADWSFIIDKVDPYRDGRANQRVSSYIKTLLLETGNGLSKDEAVGAANKAYAMKYGSDKVTFFVLTER